jgi:hypothetical protein
VISPDAKAGPTLDILRGFYFFLAMIRSIQIRDRDQYSTCQAKLRGGHLFDDVLPEASSVLKPPTLGKGVFKPATLLPSSQGIKSEYNTLGSSTFSISCKFINKSVFFRFLWTSCAALASYIQDHHASFAFIFYQELRKCARGQLLYKYWVLQDDFME